MILPPGLSMPPWPVWPELIRAIGGVFLGLAWIAFWGILLVTWREKAGNILDAIVRLIDRIKSAKLFGVEFAAEEVTPLPESIAEREYSTGTSSDLSLQEPVAELESRSKSGLIRVIDFPVQFKRRGPKKDTQV